MYKLYLKQALAMLKENKLLSLISILGTALAICMIMVMVITYQMRVKNYSPEDNRDRTMYVRWGGRTFNDKNYGNGYLSYRQGMSAPDENTRGCLLLLSLPQPAGLFAGRKGEERLPDAVYRRRILEGLQLRLHFR